MYKYIYIKYIVDQNINGYITADIKHYCRHRCYYDMWWIINSYLFLIAVRVSKNWWTSHRNVQKFKSVNI